MDVREKAFVREYIINHGNAYQAALKAGYAARTAKHAYQWIDDTKTNQTTRRLPYKPYLREAIDVELKKLEDAKVADEKEVMQYLTSVMRKESRAKVVVVEGVGDGCSEARLVEKPPDEREATKAAELLSKIYGMTTEWKIFSRIKSAVICSRHRGIMVVEDDGQRDRISVRSLCLWSKTVKDWAEEFYKGNAWKKTRAAYLASKSYTCERCGRAATVVHHKQYLTRDTISDPDVSLSFDNLEALCETCHQHEHHCSEAVADGLKFTASGELVLDR